MTGPTLIQRRNSRGGSLDEIHLDNFPTEATNLDREPSSLFIASPTTETEPLANEEVDTRAPAYLTGLDSLFLGVESTSFKMPIAALFMFEHVQESKDMEDSILGFARHVGMRMLKKVDRGKNYPPLFRPQFADCQFDIRDHFIVHEEAVTEETMGEELGVIFAQDFDWTKPLWQVHFYKSVKFEGKQTSAIFHKVHHCLVDGQGYVASLLSYFSESKPKLIPRGTYKPLRGTWLYFVDLLKLLTSYLQFFVHAIHIFFFSPWIRKAPWPKRKLALKKRFLKQQLGWSSTAIPVEQVQLVKRRLNTSFNDVLISCVSGAMTSWIVRHQGPEAVGINHLIVIPAGMRHPSDMSFSNHSSAFVLAAPTTSDDLERLRNVSKRMQSQKKTPEPWMYYWVMRSVRFPWLAPRWFPELVFPFCAQRFAAGLTSPPGPSLPISFSLKDKTAIATELIGFIPHYPGALGIGIGSYNGKIRIGVTLDVIPDEAMYENGSARRLADEIVEKFNRLALLAANQ
jgi:hypothetical protein